jgi:hypothetical protein
LWEKFRLGAFYTANSQFLEKPTNDIKSILYLPSIDGEIVEGESLKEKILRKTKEIAPYL